MPVIHPRSGLNIYQTFSYGPYVKTAMDAHFEPDQEPQAIGRPRDAMEIVPRWKIGDAAPSANSR